MRLPPLPPARLSPELRSIHDQIAALVARTQERISVLDERDSLIGPFPAMLRFPHFGVPALALHRSLAVEARLPKTVREVAILTVAAAHGARYAIYAHEITAADVGLSSSQIASLAAGERPSVLTDEEAVAYDVARILTKGRILPASAYARAVSLFGLDGVGELAFLIGGYSLIAMLLNTFDVPVPGSDV